MAVVHLLPVDSEVLEVVVMVLNRGRLGLLEPLIQAVVEEVVVDRQALKMAPQAAQA